MNDDEPLIIQRVVPAFLDEGGNVLVLQKEFVKPGNLRKYLQIGEVLRLEIFLGSFGSIAAATKALPELAITVVAANHVNPGQAVFARDQVFVKRLMLVPEDDDAQNRH